MMDLALFKPRDGDADVKSQCVCLETFLKSGFCKDLWKAQRGSERGGERESGTAHGGWAER